MTKLELQGKEYNIPENADELTLGKFELIDLILKNKPKEEDYTYDNVISINSICSGIDKEIILDAPEEFNNYLTELLLWVYSLDLTIYPMSDSIMIDGYKYKYDDKLSKLSTREFVDINEINKSFPEENRLSAVACVRLRRELARTKKDENDIEVKEYYLEKYNTDMIEQRMEKFKNVPVSKIFPMINFFLSNNRKYSLLMSRCSVEMQLALLQHQTIEEWAKSGDGMGRLSRLPRTIFSKSITSLTNQLSKCLHSYHTLPIEPLQNKKIEK